jgi:hypothetical protein
MTACRLLVLPATNAQELQIFSLAILRCYCRAVATNFVLPSFEEASLECRLRVLAVKTPEQAIAAFKRSFRFCPSFSSGAMEPFSRGALESR